MEAVPVSGLTVLASGLRCLLRIQRLRAAHCNDVVIDGRRRSPGEAEGEEGDTVTHPRAPTTC